MYHFLQTYELHTFEEHISHEALQRLGPRNFCPDNPINFQHRMFGRSNMRIKSISIREQSDHYYQ